MASPYRRTTRDDYGRDSRYPQDGLRATRHDVTASKRGENRDRNVPGATRADDSNDYGFDWIDHTIPKKNNDWSVSNKESYRLSNRYGTKTVDPAGRPPRSQNERTINDNFGAPRKVDLGITGQTRREEFEYSKRNYQYLDDNPYRVNQLDRPGATRRVPLTEELQNDINNQRNTESSYSLASGLKETYSVEQTMPKYDYVYDRQYGNVHQQTQARKNTYLDRSWTSLAADKTLMDEWHNMFGKIRTKWNGNLGYDNRTGGISDETNSTGSYDKQYSRSHTRCKILIVAALVLVLMAMIAVIVAVVVVASKEDDSGTVRGTYNIEATVSNLNYTPDMADKDSETFLTYSNNFCNELRERENSTNANGLDLEACVVNELKNGSVIFMFTIIIDLTRGGTPPSVDMIGVLLGLRTDEETFRPLPNFEISALVVNPFQELNNDEPSPLPTYVDFNTTCGHAMKKRCKTKQSSCVENTCVCATGKLYATELDSCNEIECSDISNISNGNISTNGSKYGSILEVECEDGYEWLFDAENSVCKTPDSWKNISDCSPVVCEDFDVPDHIEVSTEFLTERVFEEKINVSCKEGYIPKGISTVICEANRKWSHHPNCTLVVCEDIASIPHGTFVQTGSKYSDNATIECDDNYKLNGTEMIWCESDGSWSDSPACIPKQCEAFDIPNDKLIPDAIEMSPVGTSIQLNCTAGHEINGDNSVICQGDENWSELPSCEPLDCGNITHIPNGFPVYMSGTRYLNYALIECDNGYNMIGESNITCKEDGYWESTPQCEQTDCGDLRTPPNAIIQNLTISCDEGYELDGNSSIVCLPNGEWNEFGECSPMSCGLFPTPDNATTDANTSAEFFFGDEVDITCNDGFVISKNRPAKCSSSGEWDEIPTCVLVKCEMLTLPNNIVFVNPSEYNQTDQLPFNSTITVSCEDGYDVTGESKLRCQSYGNWTKLPSCSKVNCSAFDDTISAGRVINSTGMEYNDTVTIECNDDSILKIRCLANGTWENPPICYNISCEPFQVSNGSIQGDDGRMKFPVGFSIEILCEDGFKINDDISTTECMEDQTWSQNVTCSPVTCGTYVTPYDTIKEVSINETEYAIGSSLTIECADGLTFPNESVSATVTCNATGVWSWAESCDIPGHVEFDSSTYSLIKGEAGSLGCEVTNYKQMQEIVFVKQNELYQPISLYSFQTSTNGTVSTSTYSSEIQVNYTEDGTSVSLYVKFPLVDNNTCGTYACGILVNDAEGTIASKFNTTNVTVTDISSPSIAVSSLSVEVGDRLTVNCSGYLDRDMSDDELYLEVQYEANMSYSKNTSPSKSGLEMLGCQFITTKTYDIPIENVTESLMIRCGLYSDGVILTSDDTEVNVTTGAYGGVRGTYSLEATIDNIEYTPDMANPNSETFLTLSNNFCDELAQKANTTNSNETTLEGCVVNELKNGSVIVSVTIIVVLTGDGTPPSADVIYVSLGIKTDQGTFNSFESFEISAIVVVSSFTQLDDNEPSPLPTYVGYNATCGSEMKIRCETKQSSCIENTCVCATGKIYVAEQDSCNEIECSEISNISNGNISTTGMKYGSILEVECEDGYEWLSNAENSVCETPDSWKNISDCLPVVCEDFDVSHGTLVHTGSKFGDNATIECNDKYKLNGTGMIWCESDGSWSDPAECIPKQCAAFNIPNDKLIPEALEMSPVETFIQLNCTVGYEIKGNNSVICQGDETWSELPSCEPLDCGNITHIPNGFPVYMSGTSYLNYALIECDSGYNMIGESNITCREDGYWESTPQCEQTDCGDLRTPPNAIIQNLTMSCDEGYELDGNSSIVCLPNGEWNEFGECSPMSCGLFPTPDNSMTDVNTSAEFFFGDEVDITCNDGFVISKNRSAKCNSSGEWDEIPTCVLVKCEMLPLPNNIVFVNPSEYSQTDQLPFNSTINVSCEDGYDLTGESDLRCQSNGNWTKLPSCSKVNCSAFDDTISAGRVINSTGIEYNDTVTIECNDDSILKIRCLANGTWGNQPVCYNISCEPFQVSNGSVQVDDDQVSFEVGDSIEIICDAGFEISNDISTTECMKDGTWSSNVTCSSVTCGAYETSDNTIKEINMTETEYPIGSNLTIECVGGLTFPDENLSSTVTCNTTAMWSWIESCDIPGYVQFDSSTYSMIKGEVGSLDCDVTNYKLMQEIVFVKLSETNEPILLYSFQTSTDEAVSALTFSSEIQVNYTLLGTGVLLDVKFPLVDNNTCGTYACGILVNDEDGPIVSKFNTTNVTVTDISSPGITVSSLSVEVSDRLIVNCTGYLDRDMSDAELYLEVQYGANTSYGKNTDPSKSGFEIWGCQFITTKTYDIENVTESLIIRCGLDSDGVILTSNDIEVNVTLPAYAEFKNESYVFFVGEEDLIQCDFYGQDVQYVIIQNSNETSLINITANDVKEEIGPLTVNDGKTSIGDMHSRVVADLDLSNWCSKGGLIGEDTYTCIIIYDGGKTISAETTVKVTKEAGVPELEISVEIVEGKDTTAEKLFACRGELGNPQGSLEVETNVNDKYETLLSLDGGMNNTDSAWIVSYSNETSECGVQQTIEFALKTVSMSMHLTSMRCVIKPPDNTSNVQVSESKVIKVVPETYCESYDKYTTIQHLYYCHSAVTCYSSGTIEGVPAKCGDDQCYDTRTITCSNDCVDVGCMFEPIVCDKTSASTLKGSSVDFMCNTQDMGEPVTDISVNGANIPVSEQLPDDQAVTDNVNLTITDEHFILSVVNVSCNNDKDYAVNVNDKWNITLKLGVESEPGLPSIELPEAPNANEGMKIVCNGSVGRDADGNQRASVHLEVADEDVKSAYVRYDNTDDIEKESILKDCAFIETVTYTILPSQEEWNGTYVRCMIEDDSTVYETTIGHLITLGLPNVFCNPVTAMKHLEDAAVFECDLQDIADILSIRVQRADNENNMEAVINANISGLPWNYADNNVMVSVPSMDKLTLSFDNVSCTQEGKYTVNINDASAVMSLRIVAPPSVPTLYVQSNAGVNQFMEINCSAELGRDSKGVNRSELFLEVQFQEDSQDQSEFSVYTQNVQSSNSESNCKLVGVLDLTFYPDGSWNNSLIRCVTRDGNNTYNVSMEKTLVLKPAAVYFENESGIGMVDENYTMVCIVDGMTGLTDIVINKNDNTDDITTEEDVFVIKKHLNDNTANLTIVKTVKCGDDGVYYCRPKGTSITVQAETSLSVHWRPGNPIINLSYDMVENSPLWAGYETVCTADIGYSNASIFIQTNRNGVFENLTQSITLTYPKSEYKPSECSNVRAIAFQRTYTADWNETVFRCVVGDADNTLMDAEIIYVVPESICDNKSSDTIVSHPFDCRARFTCTDGDKRLIPYSHCTEADECHDGSSCVDCKDVGKCREDPLDMSPYMDCKKTEVMIGGIASINCSLYHITIDQASVTDITLSNNGAIIIDTNSDTPSGDSNEATYTSSINSNVSLVVNSTTIRSEFNPVGCDHEGTYVVVYDNGTSEIEETLELDVYSRASAPTISKSSDKFYRGVEITVTCRGAVGKPEGSLELMFRSSSSDNFESSPFTIEDSSYDADNCSYIAEVNYTFVVFDDMEGYKYQCKSVGEDDTEYESSIEEVHVENSDIYFTVSTIRAEIGEDFQSTCVLSGGSGSSGATISLTQSNGTTIELCRVNSTGTGTCAQQGFNVTVQDDGDNRTVVVSATAACQYEGALYCYSPENSQVKTSSQLIVTRQVNTPELILPTAFVDNLISSNTLKCTADAGYPSSNRMLKIQQKKANADFEDFSVAAGSDQCGDSETIVTKSNFAFQQSDNETEFRCIVFDGAKNETLTQSNTTTLNVYDNECPTDEDGDFYIPHPTNCHKYVRCYSRGRLVVQPCGNDELCFDPSGNSTVCDASYCPC